MSKKIDVTDKEILKRLQDDARVAFRKISEELMVSESTVFVRVKKLQEKGIIQRFTTIISPEMVGKGLTAFILIKVNPQRYVAVLDFLKKYDDVYEIYDVTGNYYTIAKVRVGNREELAKMIDEIGLIEGVTSTETAIVLRKIKEETRINL
ncbi:MAG: Lrp/AsnC family transcriptional regulator [Candidatus Hodarchaeota archaeon]